MDVKDHSKVFNGILSNEMNFSNVIDDIKEIEKINLENSIFSFQFYLNSNGNFFLAPNILKFHRNL